MNNEPVLPYTFAGILSLPRGWYYTVVLPYVEPIPSKWYPTDPAGKWSRLTRGAFMSTDWAHNWAKQHLNGGSYEVVCLFWDGEREHVEPAS